MNNDKLTFQLDKIYEEESKALEARWRSIHLRTMAVLSVVVVAVEMIMAVILQKTGMAVAAPDRYYIRYVLIPLIVYAAIDMMAYCFYRFSNLDGKYINYVISIAFVLLFASVCVFHDYFVVVFAGGVAAILLTTIYGDQRLTGITTLAVIVSEILVIHLNKWDAEVVRNEAYVIDVSLVIVIQLSTYLISVMIVQWEEKRRRAVVMRQMEIESLRKTATRDQLTGIGNRLGLRQFTTDRKNDRIIFAMMDVDHFKSVNDRWGHEKGDRVLERLGNIMQEAHDGRVSAFRYGGDEFVVAFTDTGAGEASAICEDIRSRFCDSISPEMREMGVDLSFGLSPEDETDASAALHLADEALYRCKRS